MLRVALIGVLLAASAASAAAQDVLPFLREQRFLTRAQELVRQHGERPEARPPVPLPLRDSVLAARLAALPQSPVPPVDSAQAPEVSPRNPFAAREVRHIKKLERPWFSRVFEDVQWAFLGSNHVAPLDTMLTWRLRAALEADYGSPTQTIVEVAEDANLSLSNAIQFEYWLVVNDTIPLIVSDVSGPLDRGLVIATDHRFRSRLPELRDVIFGSLVRTTRLDPFADYYFDVEGKQWYLVGYDGNRFIMRATPRPSLRTRPLTDALRR